MMLYMLNKAFLGLVLMILSVEANVAENTLKQIHVVSIRYVANFEIPILFFKNLVMIEI